jgi:putative N-acetylmannosamine-6-phosphate epimerase
VTRDQLLRLLAKQPLVVSVQASERSPVDDTETLAKLAQASVAQGIKVIRLEGAERVHRIRSETGAVTIGLIKRSYPGSDVYITPTTAEVDYLLATGCEVIALDATLRRRPANQSLRELVARIQKGGALAMADCDCLEAALAAIEAGADLIGTTLAGYTDSTPPAKTPLRLLQRRPI